MDISLMPLGTGSVPKENARGRLVRFAAIAGLLFAAALLLSAPGARADDAYTSANVSMRAGPAVDYPRLLVLNAGTPVTVYGCVADYSWCDTSFQDARGWVAGSYLTYPYQGNRVAIPAYGAQLGLAILNFSLDSYWGSYYRNRPWYGQRSYWDRHVPRPGYNRPGLNRPGFNRPGNNRPGYNRPSRPRPPQTTLPSRPRPQPQRPGNNNRPSRPKPGGNNGPGNGNRPSRPNPGNANRPTPGQGAGKPSRPPRPTTRPAQPGNRQSN